MVNRYFGLHPGEPFMFISFFLVLCSKKSRYMQKKVNKHFHSP